MATCSSSSPPPSRDAPAPGNTANSPAWFVGMDRNRDGDVSRREFLGAPEHFRLFDTMVTA